MQLGKSPCRKAGTWPIAAVALALALAPGSAWAARTPPSDGDLSPRLAELTKPAVRSAPPAKQAEELSLAAEGPGSLLREGSRVLVEVRFDHGAAAGVDDLRSAGAKIVNVSPRHQTVTVAAKPEDLRKLSGVPLVAGATEVLTPIVFASTCPSGSVVSEGDLQLHAKEAREALPLPDGSGVIVGILSDSFDRATEAADGSGPVATHKAEDVAGGDLPGFANTCGSPDESTPVEVLDDTADEGADEGRAMAQIVHDLAPGANIAFATAFTGETAFAENIEELAKPPAEGGVGAQVVVDDVAYPGEPFFQEGPVAVAVKHATEDGATYFSSAGNNSTLDAEGHEIGSWEAAGYRDSGGCPPALQAFPEINPDACMDFNPGSQTDRTLGIKVAPGGELSVDLQWNEPWRGVATDLDAFLLDSSGNLIASSSADNLKASNQRPLEFFGWENNSASQRTVQLVINRFSGGSPRLKVGLLENGSGVSGTEYPRSTGTDVVGPTVFGHNGAADAISVGAVPFSKSSAVEKYSSRGPVTHYFGPVNGSLPALALGSPEVLSKPEIAATDCGQTTFFAFEPLTEPVWRFCGTSAAAPHAAAIAALMIDAKPSATPAEIRAAQLSSAVPVGGPSEFDECAVGAGLVEAVGAVNDLLTPPVTPVEPECEPPAPEASPEEARATGNWGLESIPATVPPTPPIQQSPGTTQPEPPEADKVAPTTFFQRHPRRKIRTRARTATAVFDLGSNEEGVTFLCQVDGGPSRRCPTHFERHYRVGAHEVRVSARDSSGNLDQTAAVFRFRVKQVE